MLTPKPQTKAKNINQLINRQKNNNHFSHLLSKIVEINAKIYVVAASLMLLLVVLYKCILNIFRFQTVSRKKRHLKMTHITE